MAKLVGLCLVAVLVWTACFRSDPDVTSTGKGRPLIEVTFPERAAPGSVQTAVLDITNPGPVDMTGLLVSFAVLGRPTTAGVPTPLVGFGSGGENPSIVGIDPRPQGISEDGVVYRFGGLREGASTTISFEIRVPTQLGPAANSVIVSDAQEIDRAHGVPLETTVEG